SGLPQAQLDRLDRLDRLAHQNSKFKISRNGDDFFQESLLSISTNSSACENQLNHRNSHHHPASFNNLNPISNWSETDVRNWLDFVGFNQLASISQDQGIDGSVLANLDDQTVKDLGLIKVGQRLRLMKLIRELNSCNQSNHHQFEMDSENNLNHHAINQINLDHNFWLAFHTQDHRIKFLEKELGQLRKITQSLQKGLDHSTHFNLNWDFHSSFNPLNFLSKPSLKTSLSTSPISASSIPITTTKIDFKKIQNSHHQIPCNYSPLDFNTSSNYNQILQKSSLDTSELSQSTSPTNLKDNLSITQSDSPTHQLNHSINHLISQSDQKIIQTHSKTFQDSSILNSNSIQSSQISIPSSTNPPQSPPKSSSSSPKNLSKRRQSSQNWLELHRKLSFSKLDGALTPNPSISSSELQSNLLKIKNNPLNSNLLVARKPSLLTRRPRSPVPAINTSTLRNLETSNNLKDLTSLIIKSDLSNSIQINPSTSSSNLNLLQSSPLKITSTDSQKKIETSLRVKSNNAESVIELLSNHLSAFHINEPHAWSKHVLILRTRNKKEHCLSYDQIPLKVYRSFKSRQGVDFLIRSIDEIPSPLRWAGITRKVNHLNLESQSDSNFSNDKKKLDQNDINLSKSKIEIERKPLNWALAICGYQSDQVEELNIKAGQSFKIKSYSNGRYLLERESNLLSSPQLSSPNSKNSPTSITHSINSIQNENLGWVAENCILESTQPIRLLTSNGSSLKDLISKPIEASKDCLDLSNLTTQKISLIGFQSHSITWSGELTNLKQGELLRAFNAKTRLHWTYCIRESNGERGWIPSWILSSNLQIFLEPSKLGSQNINKLQTYLLKQENLQSIPANTQKASNLTSDLNLIIHQPIPLERSFSSASISRKFQVNKPISSSASSLINNHLGSDESISSLDNSLKRQIVDSDGSKPIKESSNSIQTCLSSLNIDNSRCKNLSLRRRRSKVNILLEL
ncbi:hypothetical protein O181_073012, partial [Austropuccinia psidii MF-1]|nr:hypothetical protein [Austropuccinia psidii MF-1]